MVIPKGRIFSNVVKLLNDSGISIDSERRMYFPRIGDPEIEAKILKPQNIACLVELGSHDIGFTGYDWIIETNSQVAEIMDLKLDPVEIVAAVPFSLEESGLRNREIIVASEYENISRRFLKKENYNFMLIRTYGASEAYPPEDADMVIDNISTGNTLKDHSLRVIAKIMNSSTRFIVNKKSLEDKWKREKIEELKMLFEGVINARERVILEMNVPPEKLEKLVFTLPCMRAPTVSTLYRDMGYAVKVAVKKGEILKLIPKLKQMGATDILECELKKVII